MSERAALVLARGAICPTRAVDAARWPRRRFGGVKNLAPQTSRRGRRWAIALASLAACLALTGLLTLAHDSGFSLELDAGCRELSACSRLEAKAEQRLLDCWLVCRSEVMDLQRARLLRYKAEERSLVRDHYEKRDAADRAEALAAAQRQREERQRERDESERASEREHQRRMELEQARREHADRLLARERTRRLAYLGLLGVEGRKQRLHGCHAKSAACEQLILDLVESTTDATEQRALAELHERLLGGLEPRAAAQRAPSAGQTELERAASRRPREPVEHAAANVVPSS